MGDSEVPLEIVLKDKFGNSTSLRIYGKRGENLLDVVKKTFNARVEHSELGEWITELSYGGLKLFTDEYGGIQGYINGGLPFVNHGGKPLFLGLADLSLQDEVTLILQYDPYLQDLPDFNVDAHTYVSCDLTPVGKIDFQLSTSEVLLMYPDSLIYENEYETLSENQSFHTDVYSFESYSSLDYVPVEPIKLDNLPVEFQQISSTNDYIPDNSYFNDFYDSIQNEFYYQRSLEDISSSVELESYTSTSDFNEVGDEDDFRIPSSQVESNDVSFSSLNSLPISEHYLSSLELDNRPMLHVRPVNLSVVDIPKPISTSKSVHRFRDLSPVELSERISTSMRLVKFPSKGVRFYMKSRMSHLPVVISVTRGISYNKYFKLRYFLHVYRKKLSLKSLSALNLIRLIRTFRARISKARVSKKTVTSSMSLIKKKHRKRKLSKPKRARLKVSTPKKTFSKMSLFYLLLMFKRKVNIVSKLYGFLRALFGKG